VSRVLPKTFLPRKISLSELRVGETAQAISEDSSEPSVAIIDAMTVEDLELVARQWCAAGGRPILVGSAGIARALARLRDTNPRTASRRAPPMLVRGDAIVLVAGSAAPTTRRQLATLGALGCGNAGEEATPQSERVVCFVASPATTQTLDAGQEAARVATSAAAWARTHDKPRALIVAGGRTGRALMDLLGVQAVRIDAELEPGIPIGRLVGGPWDGVALVAKAGDFGDDALIARIVEHVGDWAT